MAEKARLGFWKKLLQTNVNFVKIFEKVDFISLGKGQSRKRAGKLAGKEKVFKYDIDYDVLEKDLVYDDVDRLLTKIRDEAHRFSNVYREKQMQKEISSYPK